MIKSKLFFIGAMIIGLIFSGCSGGGGSSKNKEVDTDKVETVVTALKIDTKDIVLDKSDEYSLVSNSESVNYSAVDDNTTDENISTQKDRGDVIMLLTKTEQPVLMARKYQDSTNVDISLDSTAEMLVLYQPRFNRSASNDPQELSRRIRNSSQFGDLKLAIKKAIDRGSPCPLDPGCNYQASVLSAEIADSLQIDDLYKEN